MAINKKRPNFGPIAVYTCCEVNVTRHSWPYASHEVIRGIAYAVYISKHLLPQPWMEVSGLVHASAAFHLEKHSLYPLNRKPGGSQWQTGNLDEEKYTLPLLGIHTRVLVYLAHSLVTTQTKLPNNILFISQVILELFLL